jgi:thymidine kinase
MTGSLRLYLGCMYSGKTSELIREYRRWTNIGKKVLFINYSKDNRYGSDNFVYSHDLSKEKTIKTEFLQDIDTDILHNYDVILINEGQFFTDIIEFCKLWCDDNNKNIVVCGLDGDYQRKPFSPINYLISMADDIVKLKAFCKKCNDGTLALFTHRLTNETEQVLIGSSNYIPVCRKHYNELN